MHTIDWAVLVFTLLFIVFYGLWKTRKVNSTESYLLGDRELKWWTIGLSIMATQASAITFLSTPGQAFDDGMRFAQFYFGLPIAMVILAVFVLPIFYRLKVYTAYEYLEQRFDVRMRQFTGFLFLLGRGLAAGITIYAPAIILSLVLGWSLNMTIGVMGVLVIFYTMSGGTTAVSQTQKQQMIIIMTGLFIAFIILIMKLPTDISFSDTVGVAGKMGKLNIVDFEFDLENKYNMWSALFGGTFLFLSYFGTDQSQVARYLSGKTLTESRLGLLFNGIFKVPMQFFVLFVGIMVFMFYQFTKPPVHFNPSNLAKIETDAASQEELRDLQTKYDVVFEQKQNEIRTMVSALNSDDESTINQSQIALKSLNDQDAKIREDVDNLLASYGARTGQKIDTEDNDYVFMSFVTQHLPVGLVGLLLAVIFSAAMSSIASELNALASCTTIDFYKRSWNKNQSDAHYLKSAKFFTLLWGIIALSFASIASLFENLIEFVNIVGSLFYGTILGVFVVAFFFEKVKSKAVFAGALIGELVVLTTFALDYYEVINLAYLWLNLIGCLVVVFVSILLQPLFGDDKPKEEAKNIVGSDPDLLDDIAMNG
ncbi:MAG: sodium:solute symporter [Saprospiraceae bacterium]